MSTPWTLFSTRRSRDDRGWSLIDVALAMSILLVVTLALAGLLVALLRVSSNTSSKQVARGIAVGVLQEQRSIAAASTSSFPPSQLPSSATGSPTWCPTTDPCTSGQLLTQKEGSVTYTVYLTGGWCAQTTSGTWGNTQSGTSTVATLGSTPYTGYTPYAGYWVSVKVAWGAGSTQTTTAGVAGISSLRQVVISGLITAPGGDATVGSSTAPTSGPIASCPVGSLS